MSEELIVKPRDFIEDAALTKVTDVLRKYELRKLLPKELDDRKWGWLVVYAVRQNPKLIECTPLSFLNSVALAAHLGIEIRANESYLVPYGKDCTLILDYRAKVKIAGRAGWGIKPELVYAADSFDYGTKNSRVFFQHTPAILVKGKDGRLAPVSKATRGDIVAGYANCQKERMQFYHVMSLDDIDASRLKSRNPGYDKDPWKNNDAQILTTAQIFSMDVDAIPFTNKHQHVPWVCNYDQMALKSIVHSAFKRCPMDEKMSLSQQIDDATASNDPKVKMPTAPAFVDIIDQIDPMDDRPMLEAGTQEDHDRVKAELDEKAKAQLSEMDMQRQTLAALKQGK